MTNSRNLRFKKSREERIGRSIEMVYSIIIKNWLVNKGDQSTNVDHYWNNSYRSLMWSPRYVIKMVWSASSIYRYTTCKATWKFWVVVELSDLEKSKRRKLVDRYWWTAWTWSKIGWLRIENWLTYVNSWLES